MTNFDKLKGNLKIEDLFYENGRAVEWAYFMCKAIKELRQEEDCGGRTCKECYKWLQQEYKEPILDDAEREYLSAVIKPFRNKVLSISKHEFLRATEGVGYINIYIKDKFNDDCINLPNFAAGTMYKGMELGIDYTVYELGL